MQINKSEYGLEVNLILNLPKGLHARPSAKVAQTAQKFVSDILLIGENGEVDAKSMLDILSLACPANAPLKILAKGEDAEEALTALYKLLANNQE